MTDPIELIRDPKTGVVVALYSDDKGPPEISQHKKVALELVIEDNETRTVRRTEDSLVRLFDRGDIGEREYKAGCKFRESFYRAGHHTRDCFNWDKEHVGLGGNLEVHVVGSLCAKRSIAAAIAYLGGHGSPAAQAIWFMCGVGLSMAEFARRQRYLNKRCNEHHAKGILIGALSCLASHWRL